MACFYYTQCYGTQQAKKGALMITRMSHTSHLPLAGVVITRSSHTRVCPTGTSRRRTPRFQAPETPPRGHAQKRGSAPPALRATSTALLLRPSYPALLGVGWSPPARAIANAAAGLASKTSPGQGRVSVLLRPIRELTPTGHGRARASETFPPVRSAPVQAERSPY